MSNLNNNKTLTTLSPPPVEPAQAPIKLPSIKAVIMKSGQLPYWVVVNPDVVMKDIV